MRWTQIRWTNPYFVSLSTILVMQLLVCQSFGTTSNLRFEKMLVDYAIEPNNIDHQHPRFSWIISSTDRDQAQTAYRIFVASTKNLLYKNGADIWDSGKTLSDETIQHEYQPDNLQSGNCYFWKVIIWDKTGKQHESPVSKFETAILDSSRWKADWIGKESGCDTVPLQGFYKDTKEQLAGKDSIVHDGKSLLLRNEFCLRGKVRSAKIDVTGLGLYELFLNGLRVDDHLLSPAKTPYHKYILYDSYDVTQLLKDKNNTIGIHLGNGWYNPYKKWWNEYRMQWFGHKKAIAQLEVTYFDGTSQTITTNKDWKWADGPVTYGCIYDGEVYDSRLEQPGWNLNGFNDSQWYPVKVYQNVKARLSSNSMPPIKAMEIFTPAVVKKAKDGEKVFDMGQNYAGWVQVSARGAINSHIKVRFAEDIHPDGTIDITSNENAGASFEYVMKSSGIETFEPHFSFYGFRYLEISSGDEPLEIIKITGKAIYSSNNQTGEFICNNQLVNKIHKSTVWSQKSNMIGYPMDCPQRDERLGWMGDAQVTVEEAMSNFDMALFYENWLEGIRINQDEKTGDIPIISPRPYIKDDGIEWSSTYFILLWQYYSRYGDLKILKHHYPCMKKYISYLQSIAKGNLLSKGWIGDWGSMVKGWKEGEPESIPTAYFFLDVKIMADVARLIGEQKDYQYYTNLLEGIKERFNHAYLHTLTYNYNDGSQMANAFPLYLGIVPDTLRKKVFQNLITDIAVKNEMHLTTGVLGTKYLPEVLAQMGRADIAFALINQKSYPSWSAMMDKYNTMCEFWTLKQSKNHVMMGSIDAWFYKYIAGIKMDENDISFKTFVIKPLVVNCLGSAQGKIETIRGTITSEWEKQGGHLILKTDVPFNTSATINIPAHENSTLKVNGRSVGQDLNLNYQGYSDGFYKVKVPSGKYEFEVENN